MEYIGTSMEFIEYGWNVLEYEWNMLEYEWNMLEYRWNMLNMLERDHDLIVRCYTRDLATMGYFSLLYA